MSGSKNVADFQTKEKSILHFGSIAVGRSDLLSYILYLFFFINEITVYVNFKAGGNGCHGDAKQRR